MKPETKRDLMVIGWGYVGAIFLGVIKFFGHEQKLKIPFIMIFCGFLIYCKRMYNNRNIYKH